MTRGGKRSGSGRPQGTGKFGEVTKAIRIPARLVDSVMKYIESESIALPLFQSSVAAGLPSPAEDDIEDRLNLNDYLVKRPASTFFVRVNGFSMIDAGIHDGDILVVDRSIEPVHGKIVIAVVDGELTVKRLSKIKGIIRLCPENSSFSPITIENETTLHIWGVVTNVIHAV